MIQVGIVVAAVAVGVGRMNDHGRWRVEARSAPMAPEDTDLETADEHPFDPSAAPGTGESVTAIRTRVGIQKSWHEGAGSELEHGSGETQRQY